MNPPLCHHCSADLDEYACEHHHCGDYRCPCTDCQIAYADARADMERKYDLENR